jgi:hypothetical protein
VVVTALLLYGCSSPTAAKKPDPGAPRLYSVSCVSKTMCIAVGLTADQPFSERWNGRTWKKLATPSPHGVISSQLSSVSCVSNNACMAVGQGVEAQTHRLLAEWWHGGRWTIVSPPTPTEMSVVGFDAVDCLSSTLCFATGFDYHLRKAVIVGAIFESWNGSHWRVRTPTSPVAWSTLGDISCTRATICMATASRARSVAVGVVSWNGHGWQGQALAPMGTQLVQMRAISCLRVCVAVGSWGYLYTANRAGGSLAELWNGKKWSILPTPEDSQKELYSVSCDSAGCMAVGTSAFRGVSLAEWWNGRRWSITPTPNRGSGSAFGGVSCVTHGCMAISTTVSLTAKHLAEWWDGRTWTVTQS